MKGKSREEILGPSCYPHECGSMVEVQPHEFALRAMQEFSDQQLNEYKIKLKEALMQISDMNKRTNPKGGYFY